MLSLPIHLFPPPHNSTINCNDPHCTDVLHRRFIEVYCHSIIKSCIKASSVSIPLVRPNVQRVPGWTDHVKEERYRSLFWHWIWLEAVNHSKDLFMKRTRHRYHYAVRCCKRNVLELQKL